MVNNSYVISVVLISWNQN